MKRRGRMHEEMMSKEEKNGKKNGPYERRSKNETS